MYPEEEDGMTRKTRDRDTGYSPRNFDSEVALTLTEFLAFATGGCRGEPCDGERGLKK